MIMTDPNDDLESLYRWYTDKVDKYLAIDLT